MQMTTFVSLYQAGEGIYEQFDKVMVLNESRIVYFGPAKEARQYMIGLGYKCVTHFHLVFGLNVVQRSATSD